MQGGKLRESVILQSKDETFTDSGQTVEDWKDFRPLFADVRSVSGSEQLKSGKVSAHRVYKVFIRAFDAPEITTSMRFKWGSKILNIVYISDDRKHDRLADILCSEGTDNG